VSIGRFGFERNKVSKFHFAAELLAGLFEVETSPRDAKLVVRRTPKGDS
jgi:hypothetical protein